MIGTKTFALIVVLAATSGAVAGIAMGVSLAVWTDRLRAAWAPIDWDGAGDD